VNANPAAPPWTCPACCAGSGKPYQYPAGPLVYCGDCRRAMRAAEQIAAALACLSVNAENIAELRRRLSEASAHPAPRQRVRRAAEGAELLSLRQVDALLGKRRGTTAELIGSGELEAARVGSRLRVSRAELDRFLATGCESRPVRPRRQRPPSATGAQRAAAIRALRVVRRSGSE
jgi:excisionase family DNA binding protein